jgi:hypothetical protein
MNADQRHTWAKSCEVLPASRKLAFCPIPINSLARRGTKTPSGQASGICEDAVYSFPTGNTSGPATALYVKKGNTYFTVHVYGFPDQAKTMAMEKTLALDACSKL